jgi:hypothetical protein
MSFIYLVGCSTFDHVALKAARWVGLAVHFLFLAGIFSIAVSAAFVFDLPPGTSTFLAVELMIHIFKWHSRCMFFHRQHHATRGVKRSALTPSVSDHFMSLLWPTLIYDPEPPRKPTNFAAAVADLGAACATYILIHLVDLTFIFPTLLTIPLDMSGILKMVIPAALNFELHKYALWYCFCSGTAHLYGYGYQDNYTVEDCSSLIVFFREWSRPVHHFLARHVHFDGSHFLGWRKPTAIMMTFTISAVFHEIFIWVSLRSWFIPATSFILFTAAPFVALESVGFTHPVILVLHEAISFLGKVGYYLSVTKVSAGL